MGPFSLVTQSLVSGSILGQTMDLLAALMATMRSASFARASILKTIKRQARALPVSQGGLPRPQATSTARPASKGRDGCGYTTGCDTKRAVSAPLDSLRRTQKQTSASVVPLAHPLLQPLRVARIASQADTTTIAARTACVSTAHRTPIPLTRAQRSARAVSADGSLMKVQSPQTTALCQSGRTWAASLKGPASKPRLRAR